MKMTKKPRKRFAPSLSTSIDLIAPHKKCYSLACLMHFTFTLLNSAIMVSLIANLRVS